MPGDNLWPAMILTVSGAAVVVGVVLGLWPLAILLAAVLFWTMLGE